MPTEVDKVHIGQDENFVVIHCQDIVMRIPWQDALEFAKAVRFKAKEAESCERFMLDPHGVIEDTKLVQEAVPGLNLGVPKKVMGGINGSRVGKPGVLYTPPEQC